MAFSILCVYYGSIRKRSLVFLLAFEFHRSGIAIRGSLYSNIEWEAVIEHLFLDDTLITDAPQGTNYPEGDDSQERAL